MRCGPGVGTRAKLLVIATCAVGLWITSCRPATDVTGPDAVRSPRIPAVDNTPANKKPSAYPFKLLPLLIITEASAVNGSASGASTSAGASSVTYVSLPPQTFPDAQFALLRNKRTSASMTLAFVEGGFDPVAFPAIAGDTIEIQLTPATPLGFFAIVPTTRRPRVVRTNPPKGKRDVPLVAAMEVVFSEPVDREIASNGGITLTLDGLQVPAEVAPTDSRNVAFVLTPFVELKGDKEYELRVHVENRDLEGELLDGEERVTFTTAPCPHCPPFPTGGPSSLSGRVIDITESVAQSMQGRRVSAWVQMPNAGYAVMSTPIDANGRYTFPSLPANALVSLYAGGNGFDQPCATMIQVTGTAASLDVEVVAKWKPNFVSAPQPKALTGVVYLVTPTERVPLKNATVFFESFFETVVATTTTDDQGRYSLCRLPDMFSAISAWKHGYRFKQHWMWFTDVNTMDLEVWQD